MTAYFFLEVWTDGGARGNPGPAGIGVVIKDAKGHIVHASGEHIGATTNNVAEYTALIRALEVCRRLEAQQLRIRLDSELVVRQIQGAYKVKNEGLKPLFLEARKLLSGIQYEMIHIAREENSEADALVNDAIDRHQNGSAPEVGEATPGQGTLF